MEYISNIGQAGYTEGEQLAKPQAPSDQPSMGAYDRSRRYEHCLVTSQWEKLNVFRSDGAAPIDNMGPERYRTQLLADLAAARLNELPAWLPDEWNRRQVAALCPIRLRRRVP